MLLALRHIVTLITFCFYVGDDVWQKESSRSSSTGLFLREKDLPLRPISVSCWTDLPGMLFVEGSITSPVEKISVYRDV